MAAYVPVFVVIATGLVAGAIGFITNAQNNKAQAQRDVAAARQRERDAQCERELRRQERTEDRLREVLTKVMAAIVSARLFSLHPQEAGKRGTEMLSEALSMYEAPLRLERAGIAVVDAVNEALMRSDAYRRATEIQETVLKDQPQRAEETAVRWNEAERMLRAALDNAEAAVRGALETASPGASKE